MSKGFTGRRSPRWRVVKFRDNPSPRLALRLGGLVVFLSVAVWGMRFPTAMLMSAVDRFFIFEKYQEAISPDSLEKGDVPAVDENQGGPAENSLGTMAAGEESQTPKKARPVVFRILAPAARRVYLGGSFNDFNASSAPLKRRTDGVWEASVRLLPGRYLYKFKVDGRWELDPTNPEMTPEPRSSSILEIQ